MPRIAYVLIFAGASMLPFVVLSAVNRPATTGTSYSGRPYYGSSYYYGRGGWLGGSFTSGHGDWDGGSSSYSGGGTRGGK